MASVPHVVVNISAHPGVRRAQDVLARHRCEDVHSVRWDQPTALRDVMDPCEECITWGTRVAELLPADDGKLRAGVRRVLVHCLDMRGIWANSDIDGAVGRAVAYQSIASMLHREIDEAPPT